VDRRLGHCVCCCAGCARPLIAQQGKACNAGSDNSFYSSQNGFPWLLFLQDRPALLAHMSENLSAEVAAHTQARWVRAVPAFAAVPPEMAVEIALVLGTKSFSPEEVRDKVDVTFDLDAP